MSAFAILELPDTATPTEVEARWRVLRSDLHPDKGGDGAAFDEARRTYEEALRIASEPKICQSCGGSGKTTVVRGFNQVTVTCPNCRGLGTQS